MQDAAKVFDREEMDSAVKNLREEERILVQEAKDEATNNLLVTTTMMENQIIRVTSAHEKDKMEMKSAISEIEKILKGLKDELIKLMNEVNRKAKEEMEKMVKMITEAQRKEMEKLLDDMERKLRKETEAKIRKMTLMFLFVLLPFIIIIMCVRAF
ncbi:unnamed protein product [Eruca vesicaria subsp. sativa]|uniref:Uncharacterized protein n=1 Tax=Eruca vesicaria subsp. sativa TaxID=29727 RepID=A0ABC8LV28_ERUVS|nr:unnamed protein product [Eruca vesicaria subsp. sativa]